MSNGSRGNEEDPITLSLRSEINGLDPNLISKDPKIEDCLRDVSCASYTVGKSLAELIKIIHDSGEKCKSSTSQSLDNNSKGVLDFLAKEGDKLITLLTENIKEQVYTCFQQLNDRGEGVLVENIDENDSRQQEDRLTPPERNLRDLSKRFYALGPPLTRCLVFLSVFLENKIIKKRTLIYWWIGEGYVGPSGNHTAEQVGEELFKMLIQSGLIQPVFMEHDKRARGCVINRLVKEMLISIASEHNFFAFDQRNNPDVKTEKCARACLVGNKKNQVVEVSLDPKPDNLLSLFNVNAHYLACAKNKFSSLESIVVLQLGRWQSSTDHHIETEDTKFLDNLGVMKNLRYLSLQGISKITKLPDSFGQLTTLQILDLRSCHHLERLPNGIIQLKNLTHLDVSECPFLERMPKGLSALTELQVLKGFVLNNDGVNDSCGLGELTNLKKLRKLGIRVLAPIAMNDLEGFSSLRSLTIHWSKKVKSLLTFPPDLEKLDLKCFPQSGLPDSIRPKNLEKLKKLYIRGGKLKSLYLGTETEQWNVETLRLKFLNELEWGDWYELEKAFPSLAFIEIFKCPKLEANTAQDGALMIK